MKERYILDKDQQPLLKTPVIEAQTILGKLALDYSNAHLKMFLNGNEAMNHVEYTDDGKLYGLLLSRLDPEVVEQLHDFKYPHTVYQVPPEIEIHWYDTLSTARIDGIDLTRTYEKPSGEPS